VFFVLFVFVLCLVPNVDSVSGLSILDSVFSNVYFLICRPTFQNMKDN
jgi:hypothetical protein